MYYISYIIAGLLLGWSIIEFLKRLERGDSLIHQQLIIAQQQQLREEQDQVRLRFQELLPSTSDHKQQAYRMITDLCTSKDKIYIEDLHELVKKLQGYYHDELSSTIQFKTNFTESQDYYLSPIIAFDLLSVINEGLHNAAIHSQAKYVTSILAIQDGKVQLVTHDTGVGYDRANQPESCGLARVRSIVDVYKAYIQLSTTQNGTILNLTFPVSVLTQL